MTWLAPLVLLVLLVLRSARDLQWRAGTLLHFENTQRRRENGREGMRARVRRLQRLSTQVVIMMVAILVVTLAAGFAVVLRNLNRQLDVQYEHRALAVAQALASQPGLQRAVLAGDPGGVGPGGVVQAMAMAAATDTGAAFV